MPTTRTAEPAPQSLGVETSEQPFALRWPGKGCALGIQPKLAGRLRALGPPPDGALSLELWGQAEAYREGDAVPFQLRSPRRGYVTLFWIGPKDDVFIVFQNARIPGARDVTVDAGATIVAPVGQEHWAAILTLESAPLPCAASANRRNAWLANLLTRPHATAHWQVKTTAPARRMP